MDITPHMTIEEIVRLYPESETVFANLFFDGDYASDTYFRTLAEVADSAGLDVDEVLDEIRLVLDEEI